MRFANKGDRARAYAAVLRCSGEELDAVVDVDGCADQLRRCRPNDGLEAPLAAQRLRTEGDAAAASGQHAEA